MPAPTRRATPLAAALLAAAFLLPALAAGGPARADDAADKREAAELVTEAAFTLEKVWNHKDTGQFVQRYLREAEAVIIVPTLLKGGFLVGGEGGTGVLMAKADNGAWSYPAFYSLGSASIGLQVGAQSSEMLLLIMTGKGLEAILEDQVKVGGELRGAVGPYGAGLDASSSSAVDVDVLSYAVSKGAFIGANIQGTVIYPRESLNEDYYGRRVGPEDVVLQGRVANPQADDLRRMLADYASR